MADLSNPKPGEIPVAEAVKRARFFLQSVSENKIYNLVLEEVERRQNNNWLITLSYSTVPTPAAAAYAIRYKSFEVNHRTGAVESMKIRAVS